MSWKKKLKELKLRHRRSNPKGYVIYEIEKYCLFYILSISREIFFGGDLLTNIIPLCSIY